MSLVAELISYERYGFDFHFDIGSPSSLFHFLGQLAITYQHLNKCDIAKVLRCTKSAVQTRNSPIGA